MPLPRRWGRKEFYFLVTKGIIRFLGMFTGCDFWLQGVLPSHRGCSPATRGLPGLQGVFHGYKGSSPFLAVFDSCKQCLVYIYKIQ